ncbi:MAG: DUF6580 family putative transport protein [Candidatus Omnitrophota bacterium]
MLVYMLIILGFVMRLVPHVPNIVPIAAIALFSGAYLDKKLVPWVPLAIMILSDIVIGFHGVVAYTWGAFILIGFIGMKLKEKRTPENIAFAAIFSAVTFFVISNFGVWMAWYPHTAQGFVSCYINAVPFLRNTMISNCVFTLVFFGGYELARKFAGGTSFGKVLLVRE